MKITKITRQKKPRNYNVYIDDEFAFGVVEDILVKFRLNKNTEITKEKIAKIKEENDFQKIYLKAVNYIAYQMRSTKQVKDKLHLLKVDDETQKRVLNKLEENNFLNDAEFAKLLVASYLQKKDVGNYKIAKKLKQKGISEEIINQVLLNIDEEVAYNKLDNLIPKLAMKYRKFPERKAREKIRQGLIQKGFSFETVNSELEQIEVDQWLDDPAELIEGALEKARRTTKATDEFNYKNKIRQKLYRDGFESDLINEQIENVEL